MTGLSPAFEALQACNRQGFAQTEGVQGVAMTLRVAPGRLGDNEFGVEPARYPAVEEAGGGPRVLLRLSCLSIDMGTQEVEALPAEGRRYTVRGSCFSMNGPWKVEVILRQAGQDDIRHDFTLQDWRLLVETAGGQPVGDAAIPVGGEMPAHGHGLSALPQVTRARGEGNYLLTGVRFPMGGDWVLALGIAAGGREDTVVLELHLESTLLAAPPARGLSLPRPPSYCCRGRRCAPGTARCSSAARPCRSRISSCRGGRKSKMLSSAPSTPLTTSPLGFAAGGDSRIQKTPAPGTLTRCFQPPA